MSLDYFTSEIPGSCQSWTPERFLMCRAVPIGRLGMQTYAPHELADESGKPIMEPIDGVIRVDRVAQEVFAPSSMASARGKSIVDDHPQSDNGQLIDVLPENWSDYTVGIVLHVWRGEGIEDDILLADLLFTTARGIKLVRDGKRQLSIGYSCDYYTTGPGRAEQRNIVINHVALVEQGRCGPRCAIGDTAAVVGDQKMTVAAPWLRNLLLRAHVARDAAEVEKLAAEAPAGPAAPASGGGGSETHIHLNSRGNPSRSEGREDDRREDGPREREEENRGRDIGRDRRQMGGRSLRDRLGRDRGRSRGRDEGEDRGESVDDDAVYRERFEALEEQHEDLAAQFDELAEFIMDEMGSEPDRDDEGEGEGADSRRRDSRRIGRDQRGSSFANRMRDRRRAGRDARRARDEEPSRETEAEKEERERKADLEVEASAGEGKASKARDSARFAESFTDTCALAEIIAPGIALPMFDRAKPPVRTYDDICGLRRSALATAYATADGRSLIDGLLGRGKVFDAKTVRCENARMLFLAVGEVRRRANTGDSGMAGSVAMMPEGGIPVGGKIKNMSDLNAFYDEFYKPGKQPA